MKEARFLIIFTLVGGTLLTGAVVLLAYYLEAQELKQPWDKLTYVQKHKVDKERAYAESWVLDSAYMEQALLDREKANAIDWLNYSQANEFVQRHLANVLAFKEEKMRQYPNIARLQYLSEPKGITLDKYPTGIICDGTYWCWAYGDVKYVTRGYKYTRRRELQMGRYLSPIQEPKQLIQW